jgi:two-component system nitrogen regulation sensor histidine kinase NtrY
MANDLNRQATLLVGNQEALGSVVQTQSSIRNLPEAIVFDRGGRTLARSGLSFALEFETVPDYLMTRANLGEIVVLTGGDNEDRLRALVKLSNFPGHYLHVGRLIDPQVLQHLEATEKAVNEYKNLQTRSSDLQITVTIMFLLVGLLLLLAAVWLGLVLAKQLVDPITMLISTADRVRGGDYTARVKETGRVQEFDYLALSFNRMTKQIQQQQDELIGANRQLDRRRHFTETVLAGVSSGVLGVDGAGIIHLANNAAGTLLGVDDGDIVGHELQDVLPEFSDAVGKLQDEHAHKSIRGDAQEIEIVNKEGRRQIFTLRVAIELIGEADYGAILTFDDITALQVAQRKAAWSDVARRIAHEIKNPLTPIQLSAERLQRKYLPQITDGKEVFEQCTDTIVKHVGDIGRMVDEFSSFARMPAPSLKDEDLFGIVNDAVFLQKQAYPDIQIELRKAGRRKKFNTQLDAQQIRQALTNLLQNAIDSIHEKTLADKDNAITGVIDVLVTSKNNNFVVVLSDNGLGLPQDENPLHLTEPYVTHKAKGTGLGLAIVKKIIEDHGASIMFDDEEYLSTVSEWKTHGGANIILVFPILDRSVTKS